jgi:hypothetical protein
MDWNTILFAMRWVIITLFYFVLLVLVAGVYRETSLRLRQKTEEEAVAYGKLRVLHAGSDANLPAGTMLHLKTSTSLGALQDNDITLGDRFVSGHHVRMQWDGVSWWLEDLHSKNGTLVNRQPVPPGEPQAMPKGAVITIGDVVLELIE